jgi:hypothetical protein
VRASASASTRAKRMRMTEMNEDDMVLGGGGGRQHNN